jgi:ferritin-like metal-binding protein YciE
MRSIVKKDMKKIFIDELHDISSAEEQIIEALPEMIKAADSPELKEAFRSHLHETKGQLQRLDKILKSLQVEKRNETCKAMKGLIQECNEVLTEYEKSSALDAALISKAQRIEHYEISAYGTLRTFAKELDLDDAANLLKETLDEEINADKKLSKIAEGSLLTTGVNRKANQNTDENPVRTREGSGRTPKQKENVLEKHNIYQKPKHPKH